MDRIDILGRRYSSEIMAATDTPRSAGELSDDLGIPIATCYRRVEELVAAGFLKEQTAKRADGRAFAQFQRTTDAIDIRFDGSVSVHTRPRDVQPFYLRLVPDAFQRVDITERLPWLGRESPTEVSSTGMRTSLQRSKQG
ncbi:winged helix-turn-helix domain-containing protein (plasmid) [Haloarcula marismortui]|uniref:winged helix-turn-helix domain-containing protein n=1 Tax=Haloarcula marismortui TaxID=2238 RepID=UPI003C75A88A